MGHCPFLDNLSLLCLSNISTMRHCVTDVHQRQTQEPAVAISHRHMQRVDKNTRRIFDSPYANATWQTVRSPAEWVAYTSWYRILENDRGLLLACSPAVAQQVPSHSWAHLLVECVCACVALLTTFPSRPPAFLLPCTTVVNTCDVRPTSPNFLRCCLSINYLPQSN
jgi:hypothetical protein